jgi:hypothetical protein
MCGASAEVSEKYVADVLDFLRERAKGKAKTSLTVSVRDDSQPLPGAEVTVSGPEGKLTGLTGASGLVMFEDIKPATYHVTAARTHYHVDADSNGFNVDPNIVSGSCPSSSISMEAETAVSGFVRDAKGAPVASLDLELIAVPDNPADEIALDKPFFLAKTGEDGGFRFESVSPGHYLLGSNVIDLNDSSIPRTFYPGRPERNGAVPIDVELGEEAQGLAFVLPDFGSQRNIQVCVVDENGQPISGATLGTNFLEHESSEARLGEKLVTDEWGCVKARGYTRVAYPVQAFHRPSGADWRQSRRSESIVVPPGEEDVLKVLTLGPPALAAKLK